MTPSEEKTMLAAMADRPNCNPVDFCDAFNLGLSLAWKQASKQIDAQIAEIADLCGQITRVRADCAAQIESVANSPELMPNMPAMVRLKASEALIEQAAKMKTMLVSHKVFAAQVVDS